MTLRTDYSYSRASTSDVRTADSAGHHAENRAALRMTGSSNSEGHGEPVRQMHSEVAAGICSRK